jgi:putative alpha-1,2-mannosidase
MGFYPVAPASDFYVIGAPQLPSMTMHLSTGKDFKMIANNISDENMYIQSVKVNGKDWKSPFLPYSEMKKGGRIVFEMGPEPNKAWGVNPEI